MTKTSSPHESQVEKSNAKILGYKNSRRQRIWFRGPLKFFVDYFCANYGILELKSFKLIRATTFGLLINIFSLSFLIQRFSSHRKIRVTAKVIAPRN